MNRKSIRWKLGLCEGIRLSTSEPSHASNKLTTKINFFRSLGKLEHGLRSIIYVIKESLSSVLHMTTHCSHVRKCVVLHTCHLRILRKKERSGDDDTTMVKCWWMQHRCSLNFFSCTFQNVPNKNLKRKLSTGGHYRVL